MRHTATLLARVIGYIDASELIPGTVYPPTLAEEVASRYDFHKFPQTIEEFKLANGVEFIGGKFGDFTIQKFAIWEGLITVETRTTTDDGKAFLDDVLRWAASKFGVAGPDSIGRYAYVSDVAFYSDAPLLGLSNVLSNLAIKTSKALSEIWQEPVEYRPVSVKIGHDPLARQLGIAPFSIERKGAARFSENKYFSEAPLPTNVHLEMLETFEKEIIVAHRKASAVL